MRLRLYLGVLCIGFSGCAGGDETPDETGADETGTVDTDTGSDTVVDGFRGFVNGPDDVNRRGDLRVALLRVSLAGTLTSFETIASQEVSGTGVFGLDVPNQPDEGVLEDAGNGARIVWYAPVVHDDANGDLQVQVGEEAIAAVSRDRWLVYVGGTPPEGWPTGWSLGNPWAPDGPTFESTELEAELTLRGLEAELRMVGYAPDIDPDLRVVGLDRHWIDGSGDPVTTWDSAIAPDTGRFEGWLKKRPGGPHWFDDHPSGVRAARGISLAYEDVNGSETFDEGDVLTDWSVCHEGQPVFLRYAQVPVTLEGAIALEQNEWTAGWRAYFDGDPEVELDSGQVKLLTVSPDCTL